jgi:ATP-dependent DNA ligase
MTLCTPLPPPQLPTTSSRQSPLPLLFAGGDLSVWIGGYLKSGRSFDCLLAGVWERKGLRFIGCVRKAWTEEEKTELFAQLSKLPLKRCPFHNLEPGTALLPPGAVSRWLFPSLKMPVEARDLQPAPAQSCLTGSPTISCP